MAYTALNLITGVLLDMGVIADESTPTAAQSVGALTKLNDLIESWNIDTGKLYGANEHVLPFMVNQGVYTIGLGGDFNIPRPTMITTAFIRQNTGAPQNQYDYPLQILNNIEWQDLISKRVTSTFPYCIWFDEKFPLIEANVSPIPQDSNYSLVIWASGMNSELALNTVLSLPPGYKRALKYALFLELAPSYQIEIPAAIALLAQTSKQAIDVYNLQINELQIGGGDWFDIRSNRERDGWKQV